MGKRNRSCCSNHFRENWGVLNMNWVGQWYIYDCISSSFIPCQFLVNPSICGMWQSVKIHSAFPSGNHHGVDRFQQRMLEELHGKKNMFRNVFARASPLGRRHTQLGENWCGGAEKSASSLRLAALSLQTPPLRVQCASMAYTQLPVAQGLCAEQPLNLPASSKSSHN